MENQSEMPKFSEQSLAEKREKLINKINLMLNWKRAEKIKEAVLPQLDDLTGEEIDYCLMQVRNLDNQTQLRGPLAAAAGKQLAEDEGKLKEMNKNIKPELVEIFESL